MPETPEDIDWAVYKTAFSCTKISKLIVFQFKLLHNYQRLNLKYYEQCYSTFCKKEKETLVHLFWTCDISNIFWQEFKQWRIMENFWKLLICRHTWY